MDRDGAMRCKLTEVCPSNRSTSCRHFQVSTNLICYIFTDMLDYQIELIDHWQTHVVASFIYLRSESFEEFLAMIKRAAEAAAASQGIQESELTSEDERMRSRR